MSEHITPKDREEARFDVPVQLPAEQARIRERVVASMVTASLLAVMGTLIFAWALRTPEYPWLFAVGALPWGVGVLMFSRALWRYTHI